ncbi:ribonuclease H-like domain-containing protein, partial [Tanacetum coccineum]
VNGDSIIPVASASAGAEGPIPPKTVEQKLARKNELKAKITLMLAIPDEHLLKLHACKDAKSLWEAIKNRFGGNKESKKMQKTILKQNYENFAASSQEGLDKTYDRFQKLISQLKIHGEVISQEDANLKLLRSLPSDWNNIALIMRNKYDLDTMSMDDLYNNLKVYESKIKGQTSSSSNSQNVAFVSSDNSSSTNEIVNSAYSVSAASSKDQASTASYIDADNLKEMDLKWQVAMLTMRVKRFIKKIGRKLDLNDKEIVGFDITKVECYNCHKRCHFARECRAPRNQGNRNRDAPRRNAPVDTSTTNTLVVQDGIGGYDWSFQAEDGITNFALMAYSSSSDSNVHTCSKDCYQMGLESLEARIVVHEKNEAVYEENIEFLNKMNESELNNIHMNESEVVHSVFNSRESDVDDSSVNDRFKNKMNLFLSLHEKKDSLPPTSVPETETKVKHQNKLIHPHPKRNFVPTAVATKSGRVPVNTAKQSSPRATTSISTARPVNTVAPKPKVNDALPITYSYFKARSLVRRASNQKSTAKTNNFNEKVNIARVNNVTIAGPKAVVSAAQENGENAAKSLACWIWRLMTSNNITILKINTPYPSGRYSISVPALTKDHIRLKINTPYLEDSIRRIQDMESI